jgi:hypothetical protein
MYLALLPNNITNIGCKFFKNQILFFFLRFELKAERQKPFFALSFLILLQSLYHDYNDHTSSGRT